MCKCGTHILIIVICLCVLCKFTCMYVQVCGLCVCVCVYSTFKWSVEAATSYMTQCEYALHQTTKGGGGAVLHQRRTKTRIKQID